MQNLPPCCQGVAISCYSGFECVLWLPQHCKMLHSIFWVIAFQCFRRWGLEMIFLELDDNIVNTLPWYNQSSSLDMLYSRYPFTSVYCMHYCMRVKFNICICNFIYGDIAYNNIQQFTICNDINNHTAEICYIAESQTMQIFFSTCFIAYTRRNLIVLSVTQMF